VLLCSSLWCVRLCSLIMSDSIEQTHFIASKVFVFQVPKLDSADGFKAASWPKTPLWTGQLRVISKGEKLSILLEHTDKDGLFAECVIHNEKNVEQTTDSSRYFVLRISDGKGRNAIIGIGFNDRTQAFDFKVAVQDQLNGAKEAELPTTPAVNLQLPAGGKIHINLGSKKEKKEKKDGGLSSGMSGLKLAPPPSGSEAATTKKAPKEKKEKSAEKEAPADWVTF